MIRPCPHCGGVGGVDWTDDGVGWVQGDPCPTCVDMPTLAASLLPEYGSPETTRMRFEAHERGWFKPDPSTVMRWCKTHKCAHLSPTNPDGEEWCWFYDQIDYAEICEWVWVAAITEADALEEVTP